MQPSRAWIINDTIEKNKRVFKIPVYQRNYDWGNVECEKLYSDIIEAFRSQKKHFTGTIVYIVGECSSSPLTEDLIIDGQQRIATLMILLKALLDIANEEKNSIIAELQDLLFNRHCKEEFKLKLKPVKADDKQFQALMQNREEDYDTNSNIIRNYFLFKKLILKSKEDGLVLSDILEGMKQLEIVEIALDKSQGDDPQVIFESINSTGLELSLADKIRNFVLMDDINQDMLFEKYWLPLEEKIGSNRLADYFITYLDYKITDTISKTSAYNKFTRFFRESEYSHEDILKDLSRYAKYYAAFIGKNNCYNYKISRYLEAFRDIDQSTLYPFLFDVFDDFEHNKINEQILLRVLSFFRSYSVRRIICEYSSNSLKGLYKTLYKRLFKEAVDYDKYYDVIYTFFKTTGTKDKLVSDDEFFEALIYKKLYTKKKACRFLLASLENENSNEQLKIDGLTIEHILPQKENAIIWKQALGEDYEKTYSTYLHTLGNLTITGYNSELGAKSFSDKKKIIMQFSKAKILNEAVLSAKVWNESAILNRAKALAGKTMEIFNIEKGELVEKAAISTAAQVFTFEDQDAVAGTEPKSFTFYGENISVKSYAKMLDSMIALLYDLDSTIMENLAKNKYKATSGDRVYVTTDKKDLKRMGEIDNAGIFYEKNLSAKDILKFIKALIEQYEMDTEEFEFICI